MTDLIRAEAESRFVERPSRDPRYGQNAATLGRYLGCHAGIQGLMTRS